MVKESILKVINGILSETNDDSYVTEFVAEKDAYYMFEIGYAHDDWESYFKAEITYPDGEMITFSRGLPHGKNKLTMPIFLKKGKNAIVVQRRSDDFIHYIKNEGITENLSYKISPENILFCIDNPKSVKTALKNFRSALVKVEADGEIQIPFDVCPKTPYNEYTASMVDVFLDKTAVSKLGEGVHTLCYCLENGVILEQSLTVKKSTPKTALQFINFNVGCANATLIMLPNGKNMLVDSATNKGAETKVIPYLEKHSLKVDYYLLTHFHHDHQGLCDEILEKYGIKKPEQQMADGLIKADKASRESYLKNFGYLDSTMLCFYDEIHNIWDLGGVRIEVLNSRFDDNGNPMRIYNYPFIRNNEHNFENATSVSFMLDYNGFRYYHGADNYAFSQDRLIADFIRAGREEELDCQYFFGNHHFICDTSAEFVNTLNPKVVFVPICTSVYARCTYTHHYKENVEDYYFSHKRLSDTLVSSEVGNVRVYVNSADDWHYENIQDEDL